ncbi:MAG: PfkB family carbohydrate kinase [Anaerolineae bacterium]
MSAIHAIPDYLVIGHATQDVVQGGGYRPGGTVTYSALTARRLGLQVGILTSASNVSDIETLTGMDIVRLPAECNTVFENVYTPSGRKQYLRSVATALSPADLPSDWCGAPIVHLGPVAQEVSYQFVGMFSNALVGITPQGWLRRWDKQGQVFPMALTQAETILGTVGCVVLSLEDLGGDESLLRQYISMTRLLVQTRGVEGATVYYNGNSQRIPAYQAVEVDPTGAGDVFATAFLVRYHETQDPFVAAQFANCVASFVVEGVGASTIPTRSRVEERLKIGKLRN